MYCALRHLRTARQPPARCASAARPCASRLRLLSSSAVRRSDEPVQAQKSAVTAQTTDGNVKEQGKAKVEITDGAAEPPPLPLLQRPLGVHERPTTQARTWAQTREELMDQDKRLEKRHHLVKEATKGYFTDLNATRVHGGKTWVAPRVMIREDVKSIVFSGYLGTTLDTGAKVHTTHLCIGKVSIISMLSTKISEIQTANFINPTHVEYSSRLPYQHIQINLQENLLKSLLVSLFTSSIRKTVPEELWKTYLVSSQNMEYLRDPLGMTNRHVGYVYLVDEQCRIRWAGCADPKKEEAEALRVCTGVLLSRHGKGNKENAS
ncbi:ATP10 protein-domain-containing protein [Amylocystis lapponica]|nr:ATP10 protein-domain-containing protein [Amylocystis lapponica]